VNPIDLQWMEACVLFGSTACTSSFCLAQNNSVFTSLLQTNFKRKKIEKRLKFVARYTTDSPKDIISLNPNGNFMYHLF
jgi:hypothetical protein